MNNASRRVVLLTGSHLCHNPRVMKAADTLSGAGYDVEVLGGWLDREQAEHDRALLQSRTWRYRPVIDLRREAAGGSRRRLLARARRRLAGEVFRRVGWVMPDLWGYAARELWAAARQTPAGLFIAHSEQGLWAANRLLREGRRVGVDMEDWFSEDLTPEARRLRPIAQLHALEQTVLRHGWYRSCPSRAMAAALERAYACPPVDVIYNVFRWSDRRAIGGERVDRADAATPSIHWFSQTIGPGRGLEDLFRALPLVSRQVQVHLRGQPMSGFDAWLAEQLPESLRARVAVHPLVSNDELLARIAEHDIGFAGEMTYAQSRELTATNKIFYYLLAGLAVVASDTPGQREVMDVAAGSGRLYVAGDAPSLAAALNELLNSPAALAAAKRSALEISETKLCWECQAPALLAAVARVFPDPHKDPVR